METDSAIPGNEICLTSTFEKRSKKERRAPWKTCSEMAWAKQNIAVFKGGWQASVGLQRLR